MRIRTLPVALATILAVSLDACAPAEEGGRAEEDTAAAGDTAPALQVQARPTYGAQSIPCDRVEEYVTAHDLTALSAGTAIGIAVEGGRVVTKPREPVVELGDALRWTSSDLKWVVEFKEGLSPFAGNTPRVRGTQPGTAYPREAAAATVPDNPEKCGRYYYVVAAYDPAADSVYVSDPPIWIRPRR